MAEHRTAQHMLRLAVELMRGRSLTTAWICQHLDVSRSTAKRYLVLIETTLPVRVDFEPQDNGGPGRKVLQLMEGIAL